MGVTYVCRYSPPGNFTGQTEQNVLRNPVPSARAIAASAVLAPTSVLVRRSTPRRCANASNIAGSGVGTSKSDVRRDASTPRRRRFDRWRRPPSPRMAKRLHPARRGSGLPRVDERWRALGGLGQQPAQGIADG